jgi:hypothetical protein
LAKGIVLGVVVLVVALTGSAISRVKAGDERVRCGQNLKLLVIAVNSDERWAMGATNMLNVYNAVANPRLFVCPSDKSRRAITNFADLQMKGSSYHLNMPALGDKVPRPFSEAQNHILLRCSIHLNVALADGSVHMVTPRGLTNLSRLSESSGTGTESQSGR